MTLVENLWKKTSALPMGKKAFSIAFSQKAPYFATIRPLFVEIRPNYAELVIPKRRGVQNHIGTSTPSPSATASRLPWAPSPR